MKGRNTLTQLSKLCLALTFCLPLAGCVDDSYNLDNDIDLTMGLGAKGLQLKLGSTEKIMLADILEVDDNLKTDASNLYYLVESGESESDFTINSVSAYINKSLLTPEQEILNYSTIASATGLSISSIPISAGFEYTPGEMVIAKDNIDITFENVGDEIKQITSVKPVDGTSFKLYLSLEQNGTDFAFKNVEGLKITFPDYLKLTNPTGGTITDNVFTINDMTNLNSNGLYIGEAVVSSVYLGEDGIVTNNTLTLEDASVTMSGTFTLTTLSDFAFDEGDVVTLHLTIFVGEFADDKTQISIDNVTGRFDPEVDPEISNITVMENLPDFLQDDDVTVAVANPTLKLFADMRDIPAAFNLSASLISHKDNNAIATVNLPESGAVTMAANSYNTTYFYQDAAAGPYDPEGVVSGATLAQVDNISSLISTLPDYIEVDLGDDRITIVDEDFTVEMDRTYRTSLGYDLYVPFAFENGLKIVYTDSVSDMNEDLKDYEAEGIIVTATIFNTIPLELVASAVAVGVDGNVLPGITITPATVAPAKAAEAYASEAEIIANGVNTDVELTMTLADPSDLKLLDKLRLTIAAESVQTNGENGILSSQQYLQVNDMRLKLTGNIVANFN